MKTLLTTIAVTILLTSLNVNAIQMNYQGVVKQSGVAYQGTGYFKFALGDVGGTTNYWANDGSAAGEPGTGVPSNVTNGFFHLPWGSGIRQRYLRTIQMSSCECGFPASMPDLTAH